MTETKTTPTPFRRKPAPQASGMAQGKTHRTKFHDADAKIRGVNQFTGNAFKAGDVGS